MRIAIVAIALLPLSPGIAHAAFTDFSDYTQHSRFATGETFASNGLSFKAVELLPISNLVWLYATPTYAALLPGPGVEVLFRSGIQEVSLCYADGAGSFIAINGVEPTYPPPQVNYPKGFGYLSGTSLAGVQITTIVSTGSGGYQDGKLFLRGPINSLIIAGLELSLDDITVQVPEPAAATLVMIGAILVAARRR